jgi:hypothetical protein
MPLIRIVPPSDRDCTYGGTFMINCKEYSNFYSSNIKHFHTKNLTYSSIYTEHVSAEILYLLQVFYTLQHVLSEMIEVVPHYHTHIEILLILETEGN